jgi:hypothetical protein
MEQDPLDDLGVDGRIILNGCSKIWMERLYGLKQGQVACTCECGNEPWGSITCGNFLSS